MTTPAAPRWPSLSVERAAPGASDGDDVDDDAWVSFAEDAAVRARDDAETAVRDAEFERALERVREAKRERARAQARKATTRSAFLEDDAREERAREDEDGEVGGDVARGWRGEFAARDGDPAPAPRTLPQAWTAPTLKLNVDDEDVETFAREAATRATWASEAATAATRESDAVAELTQHVRRLSSALSACERRESAAEAAATAEAERAAATEHEYLQTKARLKARDLDIGELNQVVFALKRRVDELTDALDEARRDGKKYRMEIAELKVNDSELRRTVEKRAVSERMAYNANENTKRDILALQSKCRTLEEENGRLSERLAQSEDRGFEASKSAQRFHQLAEASARENEILQRANDAAANENARLNQELKELHKEVRAAHTQTSVDRANVNASVAYVPPPAPTRAPLEPVLEPQVAQPKISAHTVTQTTALTKQTSAPLADPKVNAPSIVTRVQMFDNSEYKRRMREGSGFFYDMQGVDAPKPKPPARRPAPSQPRPGERYVPPAEPLERSLSYDEWMAKISALEHEHMKLALDRDQIEAELNKLPLGAGRNMLEREHKRDLNDRLTQIRAALKINRESLRTVKDARHG